MSEEQNSIEVYQYADGQTQVDVHFEKDAVRLSQAQTVELFDRDQSVVSRHIRSVFSGSEVSDKSNMQKMQIADSVRPVTFYDLDKKYL